MREPNSRTDRELGDGRLAQHAAIRDHQAHSTAAPGQLVRPVSAGQAVDPPREALAFGRDESRVAKGAGKHSDALIGGDQSDCERPGVVTAKCPELDVGVVNEPGQDRGGLGPTGTRPTDAGVAAALVNSSNQVGASLGAALLKLDRRGRRRRLCRRPRAAGRHRAWRRCRVHRAGGAVRSRGRRHGCALSAPRCRAR